MHTHVARLAAVVGVAVLLSASAMGGGQAVITPPDNGYTPAEDVELGHQAAAEVEQQLPMLREAAVTSLVSSIGRRLVGSIAPRSRFSDYEDTFRRVVQSIRFMD